MGLEMTNVRQWLMIGVFSAAFGCGTGPGADASVLELRRFQAVE
jgi:hypothetical protein